MNRQRKVVITVTYNDLGMIVDTKAEELDSSAQPEPNVLEQEYLKGWEDGRKNLLDAVSGTLVDFCEQCGEGKKYNGVMCGACNLDSWMSAIEEMKCTIEGERRTDG